MFCNTRGSQPLLPCYKRKLNGLINSNQLNYNNGIVDILDKTHQVTL